MIDNFSFGALGGRRRIATLVVTVLALVGCSNTGKPTLEATPASTTPTSTTTTTVAETTTTTEPEDLGEAGPDNLLGYIATPEGAPEVYEEPDSDSEPIEIDETSPAGAPMTFAVIGEPEDDDDWIRVMLPIRPNDLTGFVPASSVEISQTSLRAFVDLGGHSMRVERDGDEVANFDIAIGTDENPTPVAHAYVTELLQTPEPGGAYGPYAFGLSTHSDQITEFGDGGDGQVGIHGTNQPELIGSAVSSGCVRLKNDDITSLVDLEVPLGMPVFIES